MSALQLLAKSPLDTYLTDNPEISFFRKQYKVHSNFALETMPIAIDDYNCNLLFNKEISIKIPRTGDLLNNIMLNIELESRCDNKRYGWINNLGINLIDYVELKIGDTIINRIDNIWLNIWHEISLDNNKINLYNKLIGNEYKYTNIMKDIHKSRKLELFIPLIFFFNKSYGLSLPLIAMQHIEIYINIKFKNYNKLLNYEKTLVQNDWNIEPKIVSANLLCDYIFLDNHERTIFAKSTNEILIEQINIIDNRLITSNGDHFNSLNINNLTKSMYWVFVPTKFNSNKYIDTFLNIDFISAIKRFILICITHIISTVAIAGSYLKLDTDNTNTYIAHLNIIQPDGNNVNYVTNKFSFNKNCKFYNDLEHIINNTIITKDININSDIDDSFININLIDITIPDFISETTSNLFKNVNESNNNIDNLLFKFNRLTQNLCKYLYEESDIRINQPNNYSLNINETKEIMNTFSFKMDSLERTPTFNNKYYNLVQSLYYSNNLPKNGIYQYSFSLYPNKFQPSGAANMGSINNIDFIYNISDEVNNNNTVDFSVYIVNYNVLRILNGVGGLRFS